MLNKAWKPDPEILFNSKNPSIEMGSQHVSIIVTNYNYEKYITSCLDSIAHQIHRELSLVIIDDNSQNDHSIATILEWLEKNSNRFISSLFIRNKINQGPSASRNTAIDLCVSDTIFIMDADNELMRTAISKMYTCMERSGSQGVYSQIVEFGDRNQIGSADIWDVERMYKHNYVDIMAMLKKSAWIEVGGFSHIEEGWEDYDFWLKCIDCGIDIVFLPEILCRYRVHGVSRTATEAYKSHHDLEVIMRYRHPKAPRF